MSDHSETEPDTELYRHREEAEHTVRVGVDITGLRPEFVRARPIDGFPGKAAVHLAGFGGKVSWRGEVAELRAVAVEIDRQLARLEVEHRVDTAVAYDAAADGGAG